MTEDTPACAPLAVFAHGGNSPGGTGGDGFWLGDPLGLVQQAGPRGFVVMVPGLEEGDHIEHTWSLGAVPQLEEAIATVEENVDIDTNKILFVGTSAGGHMAAYYGLYEPGRPTHISVLSAGIGGYFDYPDEEPDPKLPFFVGHDPKDTVVPYSYSEDLAADLEAHGHEYVFVDFVAGGDWHHGATPEVGLDLFDWWLGLPE